MDKVRTMKFMNEKEKNMEYIVYTYGWRTYELDDHMKVFFKKKIF